MRDEAYYADNFQEAYRLGIDVLQLAESLSAADGLLVADSKVRIAMILDKLDRTAEAATNYEEACPVFLAKASDEDTRPGLSLFRSTSPPSRWAKPSTSRPPGIGHANHPIA
jgi:hypothetical protein